MKGINAALAQQQGVGSVRMCQCGSISLNIGVVTLHLDPDTFLKTTAMLRMAAEQYVEQTRPASATSAFHDVLGSSSGRFQN